MALNANDFEVIDDKPAQADPNQFEVIGDDKPTLDLSKVGLDPYSQYRLAIAHGATPEDYSELPEFAGQPFSPRNPDMDYLKATRGETILAPLIATGAKALGAAEKHMPVPVRYALTGKDLSKYADTSEAEQFPFTPYANLPKVSPEDIKNLPAPLQRVASGANAINETLEGLSTPVNAAKLPVAEGMTIPFALQIASDIPGQIKAVKDAPDANSRTAAATKLGVSLAMGGLLAKGHMREAAPEVQGPYSLGSMLKTPHGATPELRVEDFEPLDKQSGSPISPQDLIARQSRAPVLPETPEPQVKTFDLDEEESPRNTPVGTANPSVGFGVQNQKIFNSVIKNVPVDVVNLLRSSELPANSDLNNVSVFKDALASNRDPAVASRVNDALEKSVADARTKLLQSFATGRDIEILPTLKASDLDASEIRGLLSSNGGEPIDISRMPELGNATARAKLGTLGLVTPEGKFTPTKFAPLEQFHSDIVNQKQAVARSGESTNPNQIDYGNLKRPHEAGVIEGLKLKESDVPELKRQQADASKRAQSAIAKNDDAAFKSAFGEATYIGGKIEGALRKGPNYEFYSKEHPEYTVSEVEKWVQGQSDAGGGEFVGMGGATPSEFEPENQFTTSNKNAAVDKERAARGLPPMMKVARESLGDVWDNAMKLIDNDSQIGNRLVNEISQTGKLADWLDADTQNAILLHQRITLRNSLDKSLGNLKKAVDDGYEPGIEENQLLSAQLSDDLQKLDSATRMAGTQLGRGLNARKMMANEDYSLAAMETRKRGANGGKPLTDEQRAEIQQLHDKLKAQQEAYEKHVTELQNKISELEAKKEITAVDEEVKKDAKTKPTLGGVRDLVTEQINIKQGIEEKLAEGKPITELGSWIQKLARSFVEMGIRDDKKLVDSVHGVLKEMIPDIDRRQVMDAISGYGDFRQLSKDEVSVELRRMKGELQQLGKIEDMNAQKPPLKSGVERRTPSALERQRIKVVNELKRKLGIQVTDPAKQLQSALGAIKTRLQHEIDDLDFQIKTGQRTVKTKTPTPLDAEATALKAKRDDLKKKFDDIFGPREITDAQRIQMASKQLDARIEELDRQLKSGEIFPKGKQPSKTPSTPELEAKRAQLDALKEQRAWARDLIQPKPERDPEASALQAAKTRMKNRIAELQDKLARGDFSKRTKTPVKLDEEGQRLRAAYEKTKDDFERGLNKDRLQNRTTLEKTLDGLSKWRRAFILSYPSILAKLTAASGELMGITPAEEAVGGVISKLPILSRVAEKAPRQGGFNAQAESNAITGAWKTLFKAAGQKLRTGQSDIDVLYGEPKLMPPELKDYVSNIHAALKEPARQNEFYRSFQKRMDHAAKNGVDITDPLVQSKIGFEAYKDANRQIFTESNMLADAFNRALSRFSQVDKATGKPSALGKVAETAIRYELPIVRIPLNIVKRAFEYSFGTAIGSARLARAMANGLDNLSPEQADVIIRNFKRGSLGLAMVALGFFNPQNVGGYYQQGQKRNPKDAKIGGLKLFGTDIPPALVHNPLLEQLQIGATIRRVAESKLRKKDQTPQGYANGVMAAYGGLIEETPFVRQAEDSLKALNPHERQQFLGQLLQSTVPGIAQWAAQQMDRDRRGNMVQRKPVTAGQYFEAAVPGLREHVPVKRP